MFTTLDEWKQERERRYEEVRNQTAKLSESMKRAVEVEEIITKIEQEKNKVESNGRPNH